MTFDNADELRKIAREHPGAQVVLRILTDDSASVCRLGLKFGAPLSAVRGLLLEARALKLDVLGVSYHVGSGNGKAESFAGAVRDARTAFDIAAGLGMRLRLLDIGGGFPGSESGVDPADEAAAEARAAKAAHAAATGDANPYAKHPSFRTIAAHVRAALDEHFPAGCGVSVIAEPGRFFVKSSHTLAVNVVGKRATADEAPAAAGGAAAEGAAPRTRWYYYVNDGLYGSFNCVLYDHATAYPNRVLKTAPQPLQQQQRRGADAKELAAPLPPPAVVGEIDLALIDLRASSPPAAAPAAPAADAEHAAHLAAAAALRQHLQAAVLQHAHAQQQQQRAAQGSGSGSGGAKMHMHMRGLRTSAASPAPSAFGPLFPTTLWGPTCDSIDKITDVAVLPELDIGDWLVFENMGAYTIAGSCQFNGFPLSTKVYRHLDGSVEVRAEAETE
jgi:diaminopimelate decarboxylase